MEVVLILVIGAVIWFFGGSLNELGNTANEAVKTGNRMAVKELSRVEAEHHVNLLEDRIELSAKAEKVMAQMSEGKKVVMSFEEILKV